MTWDEQLLIQSVLIVAGIVIVLLAVLAVLGA